MSRCFELARSGSYYVAPNPMVGCVIVHNNLIIGEGFHKKYGDAHAEVNAIASVKDKSLLKESTLYVNLEPCSHHGKTPPCADLIVKHQLKRVVVANLDSNPEVAGKGIAHLEANHIEVKVGVLKAEGRNVNRRFFTFHEKKRPYILLKWAQSADGYLDMERNDSLTRINWISNEKCKRLSHIWRAEESAILVGKNTVTLDNPTLTTREVEGPNPIRILIDTENSLYSEQGVKRWNIFNDQAKTLVFNYREERKIENIEWIKLNKGEDFLKQLLRALFERNIQSVIIEGGRFTLDRFIENNLWDEARVIRGLPFFCNGVKAPELKLRPIISEILGGDHIDYYKNP